MNASVLEGVFVPLSLSLSLSCCAGQLDFLRVRISSGLAVLDHHVATLRSRSLLCNRCSLFCVFFLAFATLHLQPGALRHIPC